MEGHRKKTAEKPALEMEVANRCLQAKLVPPKSHPRSLMDKGFCC